MIYKCVCNNCIALGFEAESTHDAVQVTITKYGEMGIGYLPITIYDRDENRVAVIIDPIDLHLRMRRNVREIKETLDIINKGIVYEV